jgi:hypothetical protein
VADLGPMVLLHRPHGDAPLCRPHQHEGADPVGDTRPHETLEKCFPTSRCLVISSIPPPPPQPKAHSVPSHHPDKLTTQASRAWRHGKTRSPSTRHESPPNPTPSQTPHPPHKLLEHGPPEGRGLKDAAREAPPPQRRRQLLSPRPRGRRQSLRVQFSLAVRWGLTLPTAPGSETCLVYMVQGSHAEARRGWFGDSDRFTARSHEPRKSGSWGGRLRMYGIVI